MDKSTQLIIDALIRAASKPSGLSLYSQKGELGLFPATSIAKTAAERAKSDGLIDVIESDVKGKAGRELCRLTEKGMNFLVNQSNPRQVLEDFVRALESRQEEVQEIAHKVKDLNESLKSIREVVEHALPRITDQSQKNGNAMNGLLVPMRPQVNAASDALIADVKARLAEWHASAGASQDCPLPELYRKLESTGKISVGLFHDALRQLYDDHQIYLHPWTGPLYALPEPAFALLVGHEIAYYASIR